MNKNILLDKLPQFTPSRLRIRTDFRESIKFELLMQDKNIKKEDKIKQALILYYYDLEEAVKDIKQSIKDMLWFYTCGEVKEETSQDEEDDEDENQERIKQIYSYEFDDKYIYSAFVEDYRINLNRIKYLHWWEFKALFNGLSEKTKFEEIMGYRAMNLSKIKDKEMKNHYRKMKELYALPDMRSEEEKEADFAESLW